MRAALPPEETHQLLALQVLRVLDAGTDERFDQIVRLAAEMCRTPLAAITLTDGARLWAKARVGALPGEISSEGSFCAHTIGSADVLVVPDATVDERFAQHPLVADDTNVRFYAGAPLLTGDGHAVGALCVLDTEARDLEPWQAELLQVLARQVMALMQLDMLHDDHAETLDDLDMARRHLAFLATHDTLTGLLNRQAVTAVVEGLVAGCAAGPTTPTVLVIDLDNFKDVNNALGHDAGDRVLVTVADRIHLGARGDDVVARVADDQFVVVVPNASGPGAESLARRLLHAIAVPVEFRGDSISVTASIGIARWNHGVTNAGQLLRNADAAMTEAKHDGRNRTSTFDHRVAHSVSRRLDTNCLVRRVIADGTMRLDFQPLWSLSTGTVMAHEALLRWNTSRGPSMSPAAFVQSAEAVGLIGAITRFTIHESCSLAARRRAAGEVDAAVTVNLSSVQLDRDEVILVVATALDDSGLDPSGLILELTDSARVAESSSGQATLRELQRLGVRIALDDFGTGFSSLALLRSFPFDIMKIDRSFVATTTAADLEVLRSIVRLGHSMGMTVVAEGIEDVEVLQQLRLVGCDVAQGYLLGRPGAGDPPNNMAIHPLIPVLAAR
jgi:diguanylate cyclase (GGDEF)-like protein